MRYLRDTIISTQSGATSIQSSPIDANQLLSISLQAIATGTIAGTIKIQFSNDFAPNNNPSNWSDVPSASVAVSSAGIVAIGKIDLCYRWLQVIYTASSGTGNLTASINCLSM